MRLYVQTREYQLYIRILLHIYCAADELNFVCTLYRRASDNSTKATFYNYVNCYPCRCVMFITLLIKASGLICNFTSGRKFAKYVVMDPITRPLGKLKKYGIGCFLFVDILSD